jgi:hypothetical protein
LQDRQEQVKSARKSLWGELRSFVDGGAEVSK